MVVNQETLFRYPEVDSLQKNASTLQPDGIAPPELDLRPTTPKLRKCQSPTYQISSTDCIRAIWIHIVFVALICIVPLLPQPSERPHPAEFVEVEFGLTSLLSTQTPWSTAEKSEEKGEQEATKTKEDLPQLPRNAAPEAIKEAQKQSSLVTAEKSDMTMDKAQPVEPSKTPPKTSKKEKPNNLDEAPPNARKLKSKDFLERKIEDLKKVDEKRQDGVLTKTKPDGKMYNPDERPKSPFAQSNMAAPPAPFPTGSAQGTSLNALSTYKQYLAKQLKLHWNLSKGGQFPNSYQTNIRFMVNRFGYLVGEPTVAVSSGHTGFDELALQSVRETFPVPTVPPAEISTPLSFVATFTNKDVE